VDRRRFLKYLGAGAAVAGVAAGAYELYSAGLGRKAEVVIQTITRVNHPPMIGGLGEFEPKYLNPTTAQVIKRAIEFYDVDNDPLAVTWFLDGEEVGHGEVSTTQLSDGRNMSRSEYLTKLPEGSHIIVATVSDGMETVKTPEWYGRNPITVEPDQIYPTKPIHLRYKGITYFAGPVPPDWAGIPNPDHDEMDEQLDTIRKELGCNAIVISSGKEYEDKLIECSRMAIEKGFERVYVQPRYMGLTVDDTVERIREFVTRVRALREASERVVFSVGHEFPLETAIVKGDTWSDRAGNLPAEWQKVTAALPGMFATITNVCKENYGYELSYSAIPGEVDLVPWENPMFESVGVDAYVMPVIGMDEGRIIDLLSRLKIYQKPVCSMEAGCMTFKGAAYFGGVPPGGISSRPYDEDEQAGYIESYCEMLNRARIDGYFYTQYNDPPYFQNGFGLINGFKRKKGFYMYKSYQWTSS